MEKIVESLSPFGKFQKLVLLLIGMASSLTAMFVYASVFTAARPKLNCYRVNGSGPLNEPVDDSETCFIWKQLQSNRSVFDAVIA